MPEPPQTHSKLTTVKVPKKEIVEVEIELDSEVSNQRSQEVNIEFLQPRSVEVRMVDPPAPAVDTDLVKNETMQVDDEQADDMENNGFEEMQDAEPASGEPRSGMSTRTRARFEVNGIFKTGNNDKPPATVEDFSTKQSNGHTVVAEESSNMLAESRSV